MNSEKSPNISPAYVSYGVSLVSILYNLDYVL